MADSGLAVVAVLIPGLVLSFGIPVLLPTLRIAAAGRRARAFRDQEYTRHLRDRQVLEARIAAHDAGELARRAAAPLWHPVTLLSAPGRVDVVGGTGTGWAGLLSTVGCAWLATGATVAVVDLTEQDVADPLTRLAAGHGVDVTRGNRVAGLGRSSGLTVVTTDGAEVPGLLHDLRSDPPARGRHVLVVAGADAVGLDNLEALTRLCGRTGTRLVLMVERLRGDVHDLLGAADSATLLMRLGNAREAAAAAEFVGRGHRVVLSGTTVRSGRTTTTGTAHTEGDEESTGTSTAAGFDLGVGTGLTAQTKGAAGEIGLVGGASFSQETFDVRTRSRSDTVERSESSSSEHDTTHARVYEFTVEPTTIQSLPATAFVLVESPPTGRRVVLGDADPGIVRLDRVAP